MTMNKQRLAEAFDPFDLNYIDIQIVHIEYMWTFSRLTLKSEAVYSQRINGILLQTSGQQRLDLEAP